MKPFNKKMFKGKGGGYEVLESHYLAYIAFAGREKEWIWLAIKLGPQLPNL